MTEQEPRKYSRRSDWFGSGPFNWFNGRSAVIISAGRDRKFGSANDVMVRIAPDK